MISPRPTFFLFGNRLCVRPHPNPPTRGEGIRLDLRRENGIFSAESDLNVDDDNPLRFKIVIQGFGAVLAAEGAGLHAAEGKFVVTVVKRVDPDVAGLELVDGFVGIDQIARPD